MNNHPVTGISREGRPNPDIRPLADVELDQVSGGVVPWPYMPLVLFAVLNSETGTLKPLSR